MEFHVLYNLIMPESVELDPFMPKAGAEWDETKPYITPVPPDPHEADEYDDEPLAAHAWYGVLSKKQFYELVKESLLFLPRESIPSFLKATGPGAVGQEDVTHCVFPFESWYSRISDIEVYAFVEVCTSIPTAKGVKRQVRNLNRLMLVLKKVFSVEPYIKEE